MFEFLFSVGLAAFFLSIGSLIFGLGLKNNQYASRAALILNCAGSGVLIIFSSEIILTGTSFSSLAYSLTSFFQFSFLIDKLSAFFIIIISIVCIPVAIYSIQYVEHITNSGKRNLVILFMSMFILSMILVVSSSNMFSFLFFWETMALSSFLLVMTEYGKPETRKAGIFYFIMTQLSTMFLLFAFLFIYSITGSLNLQQIIAEPSILSVAFIFLFLGFATKAGVIPFHKWLPYAHPASPSNVSALMSAVMLKIAIYGLIRFVLLMQIQMWWGIFILVMGTLSAILGVIYALKEHDLKKMLAYSSIENIGIMLIGFGLYIIFALSELQPIAMLALIGTLFHTLNHSIFKSLLFLASGAIISSSDTKNIEEMGGLIQRMPLTALFFLIGAVSISALPPFNGFVSELMIFQVFLQSMVLNDVFLKLFLVITLSLFSLTSALAAACFVKAFGITFLGLPRSEGAKKAQDSPKLMLLGMAFLAMLCILLGVFSFQFFGLAGLSFPVPNMLLIGSLLVAFYLFAWAALRANSKNKERIVETWSCGIPTQNAKMEYSASGFSEPIVTILKSIFRTQKTSEREYYDDKKVIFKHGKAEIHLLKFFEEVLYLPIANFIQKIASKLSDLQRGDVDLHVAYAFVMIFVFLLIIWWFA